MSRETPLKDIVNQIRTIEPFPTVVTRILELAGRPDVVPDELIAVIYRILDIGYWILDIQSHRLTRRL